MAEIKYTAPQEYAIKKDCGNLLVSAAAGSGKTFTLSAHIVELIKTGKADIDEMLVVTFTRAAAGDMKRKIGESLTKAARDAKKTDPDAYARLSRSAARVNSADISTIHSFLYKILRKSFASLGLPQDSRLISNSTVVDRMKYEVMRGVTDDLFEAGDEDFLFLADILSTVRETDRIDAELYGIASWLTSVGLDHTALYEYADRLDGSVTDAESFLSSPVGEPIQAAADDLISHYTAVFESIGEDMPLYPEVYEKYGEECRGLTEWLLTARNALDSGSVEKLRTLFTEYKRERLPSLKKGKCDLSEEFKSQRDALKKDAASFALKMGRFLPEEIMLSKDGTVRVLRCAARVLGMYFEGYEKKKRDASFIDMADIETLSARLLVDSDGGPTAAAREAGAKYKYVFIDEYQDTNKTQDAVFSALSYNAKRFMVGDIKQAVYRFRGADPTVFSDYRRKWDSVDPEVDGGYGFSADDGRVLHMSDNFRSAEPVTNLANVVSDTLFPYGEIPYGEGDRLICSRRGGKDEAFENCEVVILEEKRGSKNGEDDADNDGDGIEVEYVADRVASLIGRQIGERIIHPGDVAILLRSKNNAPLYRDALTKRGVPAFIENEKPLGDSPAVMLLMCLISFIDNPLRDVFAAGALRSPVFDFNVGELSALREYAGEMPLYFGAVKCANETGEDDALGEKCRRAVAFIEKEKTVSRGMSVKKYLEYLVDSVGLFSIDGVRENGEERDRVNRFCAMAAEAEAGGEGDDLASFIEYASVALQTGEKNEEKPSSSSEAVSVMTIHKSKGLEFPVCFVAECGRNMSTARDASRTVTFDKELGIGMYLPDSSGLGRCDTAFRLAVGEKIRREDICEEMRVLYVALTRACDKLIVTAKVPSLDTLWKRAEHAATYNDGYSVKTASKYIDWIAEALEKRKPDRVSVKMYADGELVCNEHSAGGLADENRDGGERTITAAEFEVRAGYSYSFDFLGRLPAKLTVSKLTPTVLDDDEDAEETDIFRVLDGKEDEAQSVETIDAETDAPVLRKPDFMSGEKYATASDKGSATHVFMQFADFRKLRKYGAEAELRRLVSERFISQENAHLVNLKQIGRFAESELMDKLERSSFVKREFRFNVRMDASDFTSDTELKKELDENGAKVTVQGVVDCLFRDPDTRELVLIDYKTDGMSADEMKDPTLAEKKLRDRHTNQLTYYRRICSEMFGEEVKHAYVYSTVLGRLVEIR